jgi:pyruvate/2-oxoglutarate dehydrogenase complex dihydrolipoamide dehydrogenase (E3) component
MNQKKILAPDICVIGAGAAGLSVAVAAASFGVPVVLVEQSRMGGECLNYGCIPSKALLAAARRVADTNRARPFGIVSAGATIDFARVRDHVSGVIASLAPQDSAERLEGLGVTVIAGTAQFVDRGTIAVGDDITIRARRVVIATGSSPATPLMAGLANVEFLTTENIFDLAEQPRHLIVIGAGAAGLELAQAFRRLGSQVSIIEALTPLGNDDAECVDTVVNALLRDGVALHAGATVKEVARRDAEIEVSIETAAGGATIAGSHLLIATGRRPNIDALNLKAAAIKADANGIIVNRRMRTSNKKVYAIGDVAAGVPRLTHAANYQASVVVRNALFRMRPKVDYGIVPRVTYTDPEIAHVGLTEAQARKKFRKIRVLRSSLHDNDRAQTERQADGHIKIVTTHRGRIAGVTIVGPSAGELILTWTLAIAQEINIRQMAELVVPYPTLGEMGKRAAIGFYTPMLTNPRVRRFITWLRRWG